MKRSNEHEIRAMIETNLHYAEACECTYAKTGRASALRQAQIHRAAAARKTALLEQEKADVA